MSAPHLPPQWRERLQAAINCRGWLQGQFNRQIMRFLAAWAKAEGGTAAFNPLNTTLFLDGATPYNSFVVEGQTYHVWNYAKAIDGVYATARTLLNGNYNSLAGALQGGVDQTLTAEQITSEHAAEIRKWGTNPDVILEVLKEMP